MFPFLTKQITKDSLLPRIIGLQALSEIFSNYFFFWHELECFKRVSLCLWSKRIFKKAPFEMNVSWGIFFFPTLFIHLLFSSTLILFWQCLHCILPFHLTFHCCEECFGKRGGFFFLFSDIRTRKKIAWWSYYLQVLCQSDDNESYFLL